MLYPGPSVEPDDIARLAWAKDKIDDVLECLDKRNWGHIGSLVRGGESEELSVDEYVNRNAALLYASVAAGYLHCWITAILESFPFPIEFQHNVPLCDDKSIGVFRYYSNILFHAIARIKLFALPNYAIACLFKALCRMMLVLAAHREKPDSTTLPARTDDVRDIAILAWRFFRGAPDLCSEAWIAEDIGTKLLLLLSASQEHTASEAAAKLASQNGPLSIVLAPLLAIDIACAPSSLKLPASSATSNLYPEGVASVMEMFPNRQKVARAILCLGCGRIDQSDSGAPFRFKQCVCSCVFFCSLQ